MSIRDELLPKYRQMLEERYEEQLGVLRDLLREIDLDPEDGVLSVDGEGQQAKPVITFDGELAFEWYDSRDSGRPRLFCRYTCKHGCGVTFGSNAIENKGDLTMLIGMGEGMRMSEIHKEHCPASRG